MRGSTRWLRCVPARRANAGYLPRLTAAVERKPPGRLLERASNGGPRGMAVLDRIRLTGTFA
jgi:hypothetical protein